MGGNYLSHLQIAELAEESKKIIRINQNHLNVLEQIYIDLKKIYVNLVELENGIVNINDQINASLVRVDTSLMDQYLDFAINDF